MKISYFELIKPILDNKNVEIVNKCIYMDMEFEYDGENYIHTDDMFRIVFHIGAFLPISDYRKKNIQVIERGGLKIDKQNK